MKLYSRLPSAQKRQNSKFVEYHDLYLAHRSKLFQKFYVCVFFFSFCLSEIGQQDLSVTSYISITIPS